ncbi:thioredoxin family protein [Gorillibacterium sp. CAU 1737]|uniref:thioredoxin family protein n=1 Tax=Gorillibacterium sp. CAU 1737 TaxID=3140362 RepID=UPI003260C6EA
MTQNIAGSIGTGIKPAVFIDSMQKNREDFLNHFTSFEWPSEADREFFESFKNRDDIRCLILAAEWCGDVVRNIPVVFRVLENSGIPLEVLVMEQHLEVMDQFLTLGGRAIPVVIFADTGGYVLGTWGPRPAHVQEAMIAFKAANPDREAADYQEKLQETRAEMARRYGEGTGYQSVIVQELRTLLSSF